MCGGQGQNFEDSERRGAEETRGKGEICGGQGGNFDIQKKVFGQKGGEFEEKTESTGGNMKDCCKGGKDKKEGRGGEGEGLL